MEDSMNEITYRNLYQLRKELKWLKSYAKSPNCSQVQAYKMKGELEEGQQKVKRLEFMVHLKKVMTNEKH